MKRAIVGFVCALLGLGTVDAQDFATGLDAAQAKIDAKQWSEALGLLLPLQDTNELAAFTAAKKALRAKYPDPFHWAPFLYMGSPD